MTIQGTLTNTHKIMEPTYLYIKQHATTGMRYLGKTQRNPDKYLGSGVYWKSHIKKHGREHVKTIWKHLFIDQNDLTEFATLLSEEMNIVQNPSWANLRVENGLDGMTKGTMSGDKNPNFGKIGPFLGIRGNKHPSSKRKGKLHFRSRPVSINGVRYESLNLASIDLNTHHSIITYRCNSESIKFRAWKFI